ncbi:MAG: MBOAT family protein [Firmicutes bacterium]|nr:MBOAT family protein [Bacillota bacterium]
MSFTSLRFLALIGGTTVLYYIVPKKIQWLALLAASCCFYAAAGASAACYLGGTILITWAAGIVMERLPEKKQRHMAVAAVCVVCFGLLALVKYADLGLIMPLGISFYTFQSVGYVIDCSRRKQAPEKNLLKYALFVSFFPQMVQGPVSRYGQLAPQLLAERKFDARNVKFGIQLALWGYMKKMIVADRAGIVAATVFSDNLSYTGSISVLAALMYTIQIYFDFSGGIDIARGAAQMMGVDMTENFRRPIFAQSLAEYWRRWHISLGAWMKDYVFYPLILSRPFIKLGGAARKHVKGRLGKVIPTALATFIVYFIIGVWHGTGLKYLVFGLWNGCIITSSQLLEGTYSDIKKALHISEKNPLLIAFRTVRTFLLVFIGRYFTRANDLMAALSMLKRSILLFDTESLRAGWLSLGLQLNDYVIIGAGVLVLLIIETYQERRGSFREWLEERSPFVQWLFIVVPLVLMYFLAIDRSDYIAPEFIYKQF